MFEEMEQLAKAPRVAGTNREKKAVRLICNSLKSYCPEVAIEEHLFMGWDLLKKPSLSIIQPVRLRMEASPFIWSASTPASGINGRIEYLGKMKVIGVLEWKKYAVRNLSTGAALAYVGARTDGLAQPQPLDSPLEAAPYVAIGCEDSRRIDEWLSAGVEVRAHVSIRTRYKPKTSIFNVLATKKGKTRDSIVVCAHHDTIHLTPGANDNAAGIQTLIELAKRFKEKETSKTLHFVSFSAEEWNCAGSILHVKRLKETGQLSNVRAVLNIDGVAVRPLLVWCTESLEGTVRESIRQGYAEASGWRVASPPPPGSDNYPFQTEGVNAVWFTNDDPSFTYHHYHRPTDTLEGVDRNHVTKVMDAAERVLEKLAT